MDIKKALSKIPKTTKVPHVHLQHSSLDSLHTWITHSIHGSSGEAKSMWKSVVSKFPTHFKWRIINIK